MIVYKATKAKFVQDAKTGIIADKVYIEFLKRIGHTSDNERLSWNNSLKRIAHVVNTPSIPDDACVCIEYKIPNQHSRIDFLIAGKDKSNRDNVVIVELKQWSEATALVDKNLVQTHLGGAKRQVVHPSYQAWSYAVTLREYNETVQNDNIMLYPCAYMHNYVAFDGDKIIDPVCFDEINRAPVFTSTDESELQNFIKKYIANPDDSGIIERIDNGRIRPSKSLQDVLGNILKGKEEFILIDDQKKVFEEIMHHIYRLDPGSSDKKTFIIEGGPGTGKTVLAMNLLSQCIKDGKNAAYVSKNSAPRNVYSKKLAENSFKKAFIDASFLGSGSFVDKEKDTYDVLIVDEAHRLNLKSGRYSNQGENQIKEIINASRISIFFIDEEQIVTSKDIGSVEEIKKFATEAGCKKYTTKLESQFRCNGSDGYLSFLDDLLDIEKSYYTFNEDDYDISVVDSPSEMMSLIREKNKKDNKARMLAGYCWNWNSRANQDAYDIVLEDGKFQAQWNFTQTKTWAIDPDTIDQIGCIHTSQGLEFSYVGVIIGDDLRYENGHVVTDFSQRARSDQSLFGLVTACRRGDASALKKADIIIRNTYRTLLSRAMKGCFVYCTDKALSEHIKAKLSENRSLYNTFYKEQMVAEDPRA